MHIEYDTLKECYVLVINDREICLHAVDHQDAVIEAREIVQEYA